MYVRISLWATKSGHGEPITAPAPAVDLSQFQGDPHKKATFLMSRNVVLEQEMVNYKKYMKVTVVS